MVYSVTKICKISFNLFDGIVQNLNDNTLVLLASITEKQLYESIEKYANISQDKFKLTLFFSGKVIQLNLNRNSSMGQLLGPKFSYSEDTNHVLAVTNPDFSLTPPCSVILITSGSPKEYFIFWDDECTMVYTQDGSQKPTRYKKRKEELDAFYSNLISNCETNMDDSTSRQGEENFSLEPLTLKSEPCYVGLVNQAMTCYLNSLLQALYMTPEFRNALYNWEYVDGSEKDEANSIPYQLQILFLKLQTSSKSAVETTSLTKSFGWDSTEVWQQHDIQELCRVMFDALEQKFANTEQADLIKRLYEGKMIDYVKCLECGTEKTREDTFLDIPLPVRPFGSNVAYNSVEEALQAFVQYETLEGTNQYHCEKCNKKCDAHKGLKFTKFPYLLTLHLKRFDFDYKTFHRIKLNDKVTFPDVLNLNSLIDISTNQEPSDNKKTTNSTDACDINSATDTGTTNENGVACENSLCNSSQDEKDGEDTTDMCNGPSTSNCSTQTQESENNSVKYQPEDGPYQYELFSIMIHSGSANGGHYYAYIKDFRTQEWMCFNDQIVSHITHDDIKKTYGGGISGAYYSGVYSSSTNAYMLMYRQIDPARNALPMHAQDFPKHMQELLEKVAMNDVKCHEKITVLKIRVYYRQLRGGELRYIKIYEIADATLAQLTEMVYTRLFLHKLADLNQCRLVSYDPISGLMKESFEGREEETIGSIWSTQERITVLLDIRQEDENFEAYSPNEILSKVYVIDAVKTEMIDGPINVDIPPHIQTVKEYKQMLGPILDMDPEQMEIGLWRYLDTKWLENDYELHRSESSAQNTFFVSCVPDTDRKTFRECTSHAISARFENVFSVIIELPDTSPEALKALNIAPLEEKPKKIEKSTLPKETEKTVVANAQSKPSVNYSCRENSERCWLWSPREDEEEWYTPEQSNSEDSSLSDSDKTLVGVAPDEGDNLEFVSKGVVESSDSDNDCEYYFKATPNTGTFVDSLNVYVDARIKVGTLKKHLEPYVGVSADSFNLYDLEGASEVKYSPTDILTYVFRNKLVIKLDDGKFPVKIHQLVLNSDEPYKFLFHYYLSTNMTVREAKQEILSELKNKFNIEIPYERFRLRQKKFKMPSRVLFDDQKIEEGQRHFEAELIIQELTEDETVTDPKQTIVYARRWHNEDQSKSQVGPLQEIVLDERSAEEIRRKISAISDIPEEYIETTRGIRLFPCNDIAFFQLSHGCDNIQNGVVFLYRDSRENFKTPRPRKVAEYVPSKQKSRRGVQLPETPCHNPRRERGLKIHVDSK